MKRLYILRSNLKNLEYYHKYLDLNEFKLKCHDFYLLQGIYYLENNYFDEVIIWRLSDKKLEDIVFDIKGKKFIQRWVLNFNEIFNYPNPTVSFFRGGFPEYCKITNSNPKFFGLKLYLAAGQRLLPQYGGIYDKILIEDEKDQCENSIPFYKTTNQNIFKPLDLENKYDICLISNFTQLKYKGTDFIINQILKDDFLKKLKFCHIGNNPDVEIRLTKKLRNIDFLGTIERSKINKILNQSKFGLVSSNKLDGCPRVSTEILTSGTPLLIRDQTRILNYYKNYGTVEFNDKNISYKVKESFDNYNNLKKDLLSNLDNFSIQKICELNFNLWKNNIQ
jgi:hypothetical protein